MNTKKKRSNRARGVDYQRWCKDWIEEQRPGSVVWNQPMNHFRLPNGIWASRSNDIFGCVDLIAVVPDSKLAFIQCSLHEKVEDRLQDFLKVPWPLAHCSVQLWIKRPSGVTVVKGLLKLSDDRLTLADLFTIKRRKLCLT